MKLLKEFSYTDIFQRRIIFVNIFLTFSVLSIIYSDIAVSYNFYFPYRHVFREIVLFFTIGIFIGNITGKGLFRLAQYRVVYILSEIFFFAVSLLFFLQNYLFILPEQVMRDYLICNMHVLPLLLGILPFFTGIKLNYFLKITCGNFIDDKKGTLTFLTSILTGFISGIVLYGALHYFIDNIHFAAALLLPILFTTFIIRLLYNSSTQYAQDIEEPDDVREMQTGVRDDIYFTFLNFTYVIIYVFLGYEIVVKHAGNFLHVQLMFVLSLVVSVLIGFGIARYLRNAFWYVYSEMIFPLLFLSFLILVSLYGNTFQYASIVFFIIPSVMFGFSAYKTINNILLQYDHNKRFNIIDLSLLILPLPIFVSLLHLRFTNMWFYIFLYVVMILNVALPGIHLMQRDIQSYKKILYIFFSIIFIPAIIFVHAYFKIPFDDTVFIRHIKGFNQIYDKNYNSMYIQNPVDVSLHNYVIFNNTDSALRNLKRALVPVYMYASYSENKKNVLFIDGYQKFFQNPLIAYFKHYKVIDYIPEERVDYNRLPLSGRKSYMVDACDTVKYLTKGESTYSIIVDIPNLFDQKMNTFKYSQVYYSLVKRRLEKHGIFAQLFDLNSLSRQKIAMSRNNMKKIFPNTVGYLFSNILLVMASDRSETFSITPLHLKAVCDLFTEMTESVYLFFNEEHMVSHLIFTEYGDYFPEMFIGRLPVADTNELKSVVAKLVRYEKFEYADTNMFHSNAMITSGYDASYANYMNGQIKYAITNYLTPANNIHEYHFYYPPPDAVHKDSVIGLINNGMSFINYTGHGSSTAWLHINIDTSDVRKLNNKNMYPFIISNACQTSKFNIKSLGNRMVVSNEKGAIGFIGCSNDSFWNEDFFWAVGTGTPSDNPTYETTGPGALDRLFHTHGEPMSEWYTTMGQIVYSGNLSVSASTSSRKKYYWETYNLVGDPSMIPIIGTPDSFRIELPDTLPNTIRTWSFTAEPGSYIAVSHADTLWDARHASP